MQLDNFHSATKYKNCAIPYCWPLLNTQLSTSHPLLHIQLDITDFVSGSTK
jgi:hypothetical protein